MSDQRNGGIVWTNQTWNPLRGCSRVSQGCVNCYAESMAARFCGPGMPYEGTINQETKRWNGTIKLVPEHLQDPLRWKRPRMVFVNSMSDLFHEDVPDEYIDQVFAVMALATQHTFQVLTKRPARMLAYMQSKPIGRVVLLGGKFCEGTAIAPHTWPLPNVWLGVTVENQEAADERIPLLLQTPAAVRWVSMEPLLGAVDLHSFLPFSVLHGMTNPENSHDVFGGLDWVVVGGESGPNARPMHPDWARILRDLCASAGVPFLFKQWGEWCPVDMEANKHKGIQYAVENCNDGLYGANVQTGTYRNGSPHFEAWPVKLVGKKAAGRMLDGVQHDGYPT